jgi:hypothetical protein
MKREHILELRDRAAEAYDEIAAEIAAQALDAGTAAVLSGESIAAEMTAQAAANIRQAELYWTKAAKQAVDQVVSEARQVPLSFQAAGLDPTLPSWEAELYSALPKDEAFRVAETLRQARNLTETDRVAFAAQATMGVNVVPDRDPKIPPIPGGLPDCPRGFKIDRTGCPKPETIVAFTPGMEAGWAKFSEYDTNPPMLLGGALAIGPAPEGTRPPNYADQYTARSGWATGLEWVESRGWTPVGIGQNPPLCAVEGCFGDPPDPDPTCTPILTREEYIASLGLPDEGYKWCVEQITDVFGCAAWDATQMPAGLPCPGEPVITVPPVPPVSVPPLCPVETPVYGTVAIPYGYVIVPAGMCTPPVPGVPGVPGVPYVPGGTVPPVPPDPPTPILDVPGGVPAPQPQPQQPPPPINTGCLSLDDPKVICRALGLGVGVGGVPGGGAVGQVIKGGGAFPAKAFAVHILKDFLPDKSQFLDAAKTLLSNAVDTATELIRGRDKACDCDPVAYLSYATRLGLAQYVENVSGVPVMRVFQDVQYAANSVCPQTLPTQAAIDAMYVNGLLEKDQYTCYTKAHGNLPKLHEANAYSQRSRPGMLDVMGLFLADKMKGSEYDERMKQLGVMDDRDRELLERAGETLPGLGELIHLMTRDAFDDAAARKNKLDTEFKEKWTDKAKEWAARQRIPDDVAQAAWRAHWVLPSNTEAYSMLHRLRPGRVKKGIEFTAEDAAELLQANDRAPGYIDQLLAISFALPTRTDLKRGYNIDAIDRGDVRQGLLDLGYDEDGAALLLGVYDEEKRLHQQNTATKYLAFTPKTIAAAIANGTMTEMEARRILEYMGLKAGEISAVMDSATVLANSKTRATCLASIRRRYMTGELTFRGAEAMVGDVLPDPNGINDVMQRWACEFNNRAKELGVALPNTASAQQLFSAVAAKGGAALEKAASRRRAAASATASSSSGARRRDTPDFSRYVADMCLASWLAASPHVRISL